MHLGDQNRKLRMEGLCCVLCLFVCLFTVSKDINLPGFLTVAKKTQKFEVDTLELEGTGTVTVWYLERHKKQPLKAFY